MLILLLTSKFRGSGAGENKREWIRRSWVVYEKPNSNN